MSTRKSLTLGAGFCLSTVVICILTLPGCGGRSSSSRKGSSTCGASLASAFDLDSTVVTLFGHQEGAELGYNPRYRGKRSYDPLLCVEANSSFLWDVELRRGDAGTWAGSEEMVGLLFSSPAPSDIRELRREPMPASATGPSWICWKRVRRGIRRGCAHDPLAEAWTREVCAMSD